MNQRKIGRSFALVGVVVAIVLIADAVGHPVSPDTLKWVTGMVGVAVGGEKMVDLGDRLRRWGQP